MLSETRRQFPARVIAIQIEALLTFGSSAAIPMRYLRDSAKRYVLYCVLERLLWTGSPIMLTELPVRGNHRGMTTNQAENQPYAP